MDLFHHSSVFILKGRPPSDLFGSGTTILLLELKHDVQLAYGSHQGGPSRCRYGAGLFAGKDAMIWKGFKFQRYCDLGIFQEMGVEGWAAPTFCCSLCLIVGCF